MNIPEVTPEMFYKVGFWCFCIGSIANTLIFLQKIMEFSFLGLVSQLTSIIFGWIVTGFFYSLMRSNSSTSSTEQVEFSEDIEEAIKKVNSLKKRK